MSNQDQPNIAQPDPEKLKALFGIASDLQPKEGIVEAVYARDVIAEYFAAVIYSSPSPTSESEKRALQAGYALAGGFLEHLRKSGYRVMC